MVAQLRSYARSGSGSRPNPEFRTTGFKPASSKKALGYLAPANTKQDAVGAFLQNMGRYKLLTAAEVIVLANKCKIYRDFEALNLPKNPDGSAPDLTPEEIAKALGIPLAAYTRRLRVAQRAKQTLINSNLRLVVRVARNYQQQGIDFLDLIQEGVLGLDRAIEKFDPAKGYQFSTYSFWWIAQAMGRSIKVQSRTIRLPIHVRDLLSKIGMTAGRLRQELGRRPSSAEIADEVGITLDELCRVRTASQSISSLNYLVGEKQEIEFGSLLPDESEKSPDEQACESELIDAVQSALDTYLTPREAEVMRMQYGLGCEPMKLKAIAKVIDKSHSSVAKDIKSATTKLRGTVVAEKLKAFC